jgi:amino acid transporter
LIPSSYASEGAYNDNAAYNIVLDLRFYLFALISIFRAISIAKKKTHFHLLDAISLSGFAYAFALAATYELDTSSYLALPFQLIATINIAWAWIEIVEKGRNQNIREEKRLSEPLSHLQSSSELTMGQQKIHSLITF